MRTSSTSLALALAAILLLSGAASAQEAPIQTLDDVFEEVAAEVPGFGGAFFDEAGDEVMVLTDDAQAGKAADALEKKHKKFHAKKKIKRGRYDYVQLRAWYRPVARLLGTGGVNATDIDEKNNQIRVCVDSSAQVEAVQRHLVDELHIPVEAVAVEQRSPAQFTSTLRDYIRPLVAGIEVTGPSSDKTCSYGFTAYSARLAADGFVTASHCSGVYGGPSDNGPMYQPIINVNNTIGYERYDRPWLAMGGNCIGECRWADASFFTFRAGETYARGKIARPVSQGGSITMIDPPYTVTAHGGLSVLGQLVRKVGRTTGETAGYVVETCTDRLIAEMPGYMLLCQDATNFLNEGGDSGGPVFEVTSGTNVTLMGIVWGSSSPGTYSYFSNINNIEGDLAHDTYTVTP
jgi:hypothetical protein